MQWLRHNQAQAQDSKCNWETARNCCQLKYDMLNMYIHTHTHTDISIEMYLVDK